MEKPGDKRTSNNHLEHAFIAMIFALLVIIGILAIPVVMWVWDGFGTASVPVGETRVDRSRIAAPLLTVVIAVITLLTVLWRGSIASRQAFEQKRQNDSRDEADLALLLEKAEENLATEENTVKRSLGLTMVETIALAENSRYAGFALELAADQIVWAHTKGGSKAKQLSEKIRRILESAQSQLNREVPERMTLDFGTTGQLLTAPATEQLFRPTIALRHVLFQRAYISLDSRATAAMNQELVSWRFNRCRINFIRGLLDQAGWLDRCQSDFDKCVIIGAKIRNIGAGLVGGTAQDNIFSSCEFSGAVFDSPAIFEVNEFKGCCYVNSNPPKFADPRAVDLVDYLRDNGIDIIPVTPATSMFK